MKIWSVIAKSESGDEYGPYLFGREPTEKELEQFFRDVAPGEWDEDIDPESGEPFGFRCNLHIKRPQVNHVHELDKLDLMQVAAVSARTPKKPDRRTDSRGPLRRQDDKTKRRLRK